MAVITRRTYRWAVLLRPGNPRPGATPARTQWVTLEGVDLLESGDEREPVRIADLARRVPPWVVALTLVAVLAAALVAAVDQRRDAVRPDVGVRLVDASSSTVGGVARGVLELLLVNRRDRPVRLDDLVLEVEGLRVTGALLIPRELGAYGEQSVRVAYLVPSCAALALPGALVLRADDQEVRVPVSEAGSDGDGIELGSCPASARGARPGEPTDIGARAAGGSARRTGEQVDGVARLEVRNAGPAVRLLSLDAVVPGVEVTPRVLAGGRTIVTDGVVLIGLRFRVPDCGALMPTGRLVLRVERFGGVQELSLRLTAEPVAGLGPQVRLPVVLESCG